MNVTRHATKRTKDRVGISKKIADKNASKAFQYGLKHSETKGNLNKYITKLYFSANNRANNIRVYHEHVYIFAGTTLITILELPNNLKSLANKLQKEKDKKVKHEEQR